jgi:hypothetical protein
MAGSFRVVLTFSSAKDTGDRSLFPALHVAARRGSYYPSRDVSMRRRREDGTGDGDAVQLAALADGSLAPERRAALEARVASSSGLAALLAEQQRAVELARSAADQVEAPVSLRRRIEAQRRPQRARGPRRLVLVAAVGTLAVAAAAIAIAVVATRGADERFHANLTATALAQGARGDASFYRTASGWRIDLDVRSLPRLDNGRFYEAWLRNAGGVLVPVGTFNDGRDVTLWAGVSPEAFTTLTITRERADGDQASSGRKVVVGTIARSD